MPQTIELDDACKITTGTITSELIPTDSQFEELWNLHPDEHSEVVIHGKSVKVPRWDRAFGKDYPFSNQVATAHPTPDVLDVFLSWAKQNIDQRLNGLFVNWHDGALSHYHGKHRDSTNGLITGTPIVTISFGEDRVFRMRPYPKGSPMRDFALRSGDYIVIPWTTNQRWTHEIPKFARFKNRRISVTLRAFD